MQFFRRFSSHSPGSREYWQALLQDWARDPLTQKDLLEARHSLERVSCCWDFGLSGLVKGLEIIAANGRVQKRAREQIRGFQVGIARYILSHGIFHHISTGHQMSPDLWLCTQRGFACVLRAFAASREAPPVSRMAQEEAMNWIAMDLNEIMPWMNDRMIMNEE